jgi:hypothetical protein
MERCDRELADAIVDALYDLFMGKQLRRELREKFDAEHPTA